MKKTFPLQVDGKHPDRLLEATKHEIRKYIQRERRRLLPAGVDYWDFDCKFGPDAASAHAAHLAELTGLINGMAQSGGPQFYIEILAKHGHRTARTPPANGAIS